MQVKQKPRSSIQIRHQGRQIIMIPLVYCLHYLFAKRSFSIVVVSIHVEKASVWHAHDYTWTPLCLFQNGIVYPISHFITFEVRLDICTSNATAESIDMIKCKAYSAGGFSYFLIILLSTANARLRNGRTILLRFVLGFFMRLMHTISLPVTKTEMLF